MTSTSTSTRDEEAVRPGRLHRICAYPWVISSFLGACVAGGGMLVHLSWRFSLTTIVSNEWGIVYLAVTVLSTSLLGVVLGMGFLCSWVMPWCIRYNGGPLKEGDRVVVLTGPEKGVVAKVYQLITRQGCWKSARLDLGEERKAKFRDIFEAHSLLKIKAGPEGVMEISSPD